MWLLGGRPVYLDTGQNLRPGILDVTPAIHADPLAFVQVLVVFEEMGDLIQQDGWHGINIGCIPELTRFRIMDFPLPSCRLAGQVHRKAQPPAPTGYTRERGAADGPYPFLCAGVARHYNSGTISSATMLMILINGLMAGPAVSL